MDDPDSWQRRVDERLLLLEERSLTWKKVLASAATTGAVIGSMEIIIRIFTN